MSVDDQNRFLLCQVSPDDWVIMDEQFPAGDTRRLVACASETDGHVEVRWVRCTSLPARFATRTDALDALIAAESVPAPALV